MRLFTGYHYPMDDYWQAYHSGGITLVSLDFTAMCNNKCTWCFNGSLLGQADKDMLSLEERERLLEDAVCIGARTLVVPGTGEPTLDPYFCETIEAAHNLGLVTVIYTNLTGNVDAARISWMRDHGVSLGIKLDSLKLDYFRKYYHVGKGLYDRFFSNLETVVEAYEGTATDLGNGDTAYRAIANCVLTRQNASEIEDIRQFCRERGLPLFLRPVKPVDWARKNPELWRELGNENGTLCPEDRLVSLANWHNELIAPSGTIEGQCALYAFGLTVKSNGSIQLCPDFHRPFSNIREQDLDTIASRLNTVRQTVPGYCIMLDHPDLHRD